MSEMISNSISPEELEATVLSACEAILMSKRAEVKWKLEAVRKAYDEQIAPSHRANGDGRVHQEFFKD